MKPSPSIDCTTRCLSSSQRHHVRLLLIAIISCLALVHGFQTTVRPSARKAHILSKSSIFMSPSSPGRDQCLSARIHPLQADRSGIRSCSSSGGLFPQRLPRPSRSRVPMTTVDASGETSKEVSGEGKSPWVIIKMWLCIRKLMARLWSLLLKPFQSSDAKDKDSGVEETEEQIMTEVAITEVENDVAVVEEVDTEGSKDEDDDNAEQEVAPTTPTPATEDESAPVNDVTASSSKASIRFDAMLADFRRHTPADINLVASLRFRGLLSGTSAAINNPKITEAFKVLYEDLGPIRVAGDLMFSKLERELIKSKASDAAENVRLLGRNDECVVSARKIFDAVDADASGTVSSRELLDSDLLRSLGRAGSSQSVAEFMEEIDSEQEGEISFGEFMVAAHHLLYEGDASMSLFGGGQDADELVDQMLMCREEGGEERADRYSKRFDGMCREFDSWGGDGVMSKAEERNPRMSKVLDGCFAGAKQPAVVDALKILYVDFLPLRLAGDLIFKLMRKLAR